MPLGRAARGRRPYCRGGRGCSRLAGRLAVRPASWRPVDFFDIEPSRAELARTLGVGFAARARRRRLRPRRPCSGTSAGLAAALDLAGDEATVLELSWYGADKVAIPLGGAFHSRRLRLVSSQVGRVAPSHRARWTLGRRLAAAVDLLADARLEALLAPAIKISRLPVRLPDILSPRSGVLVRSLPIPRRNGRVNREVCLCSPSKSAITS